MRKNYATYSFDMNCIVCKTPLVGINKFGGMTRDIKGSIYPLDYLKCPNCNREYFADWDTEKKTMVARSYQNIKGFVDNLSTILQKD